MNYPTDLKQRIEKLLSEILSDQHECKVTLRFEKKEYTQK
jgi:hypothetical protein